MDDLISRKIELLTIAHDFLTRPHPPAGPPMLPRLPFMRRGLPLVLDLGLILAPGEDVFLCWEELLDLTGAAMGNLAAFQPPLEPAAAHQSASPTRALAVAFARATASNRTQTTINAAACSGQGVGGPNRDQPCFPGLGTGHRLRRSHHDPHHLRRPSSEEMGRGQTIRADDLNTVLRFGDTLN